MKRKSFEGMACPVAQSLERVGEQWSILILRDALNGLRRFDEFQKHLDIAPNMLTRRLNTLVETGFLVRQRYSERPPRDEYVLTDRGRDFHSVVHALLSFGNRHFADQGKAFVLVDTETGTEADPIVIDAVSGERITYPRFRPRAHLQKAEGVEG
jgi:DNA-binding HxlR family transcriptional regulator